MSSEVQRLLVTVPNPFLHVRVDNAWDPVPDVAEINAGAYGKCLRLVDDVRGSGLSHGLLLHGQPGTGKTHLLGRLRGALEREERAWFVYVLPLTAPDRFSRHILQAVAGDILRPAAGGGGLPQVTVAIARHLLGDPGARPERIAAHWHELAREHPSAPALLQALRSRLEPMASTLGLEDDVFRVVLRFVAGVGRPKAQAWLLGRSLTEEQVEALDVGRCLDDAESAADAVGTLLRLAGPSFPVVLAFDQIEGLQRDAQENQLLHAFGHGVADLLAQNRNLAVVTCCQTAFLEVLQETLGRALYQGRVAESQSSLEPLQEEPALRLLEARLAASIDLQAVRHLGRGKGHAEFDDPIWPLSREVLGAHLIVSQPARNLLTLARGMFDTAAQAVPDAGPSPLSPPASRGEALAALWEGAVEEEGRLPRDVIDEGIYVDGLARGIEIFGHGARTARSRTRDIDLTIEGPNGRTSIAVCHAENMASLAARFRRLAAAAPTVGRLVILRDRRLAISTSAKRTREHLQAIQSVGGSFVAPTSETYVALAALRRLLSEAAAGDLTVDGQPVAPEALKDWLARAAPPAVREIVHAVLGGGLESEEGDPGSERLLEVLRERCVLALDEAAHLAGLGVDDARRVAVAQARLIGHLRGVPEVVFLQPEGLERH